jgi:hypothetical protein
MVASAYDSRKSDLARAMHDETSKISQAHLQDFDWKLQVLLYMLSPWRQGPNLCPRAGDAVQ